MTTAKQQLIAARAHYHAQLAAPLTITALGLLACLPPALWGPPWIPFAMWFGTLGLFGGPAWWFTETPQRVQARLAYKAARDRYFRGDDGQLVVAEAERIIRKAPR